MRAHVGGFRAIGLGFGALRRNLGLWFFGLSSDGLVAVCRAVLFFAGFAAAANRFASALGDESARNLGELLGGAIGAATSSTLWIPILCAWIGIEVVGIVLRVVYLAAAVVDLSDGIREPKQTPRPVLAAALTVLPRAVTASVIIALIDIISSLLRWTLFLGTWLIVSHAFERHAHGFSASFNGALALTLAALLALLVDLFGRMYRVRALRHLGTSALEAAWDAGSIVSQRVGTLLLIAVLGVVLGIAGGMFTGAPAALANAVGPGNVALGAMLRLFGATLGAAWGSGVELILVGAFCAVDLDVSGELPLPPPSPEPVLAAVPVATAQQILVAEAIEPKPQS